MFFLLIVQKYFVQSLLALVFAVAITYLIRRRRVEKKSSETIREGHSEEPADFYICDGDPTPALPEDLEHVPYGITRLSDEEMLQRSEDFYQAMNKRRSVRFFSRDPVPIEVIRNIIKTAGTSPSGAHTEPWTFVVVEDSEVKRHLRDVIEEEEYFNYTKRMSKQWTTDLKPLKTDWHKEYLTDAPYIILAYRQLYSLNDNETRKNHYYSEISVSIATGIMLAAIQNAGLVTLTSTPLQCGPKLRPLLGRPINEKLMLLFPVGFPADECTVPDLQRKRFRDICVEI